MPKRSWRILHSRNTEFRMPLKQWIDFSKVLKLFNREKSSTGKSCIINRTDMSVWEKTIISIFIRRILWCRIQKCEIQCSKNICHTKRSPYVTRTSEMKHLKNIETELVCYFLKLNRVRSLRKRSHIISGYYESLPWISQVLHQWDRVEAFHLWVLAEG